MEPSPFIVIEPLEVIDCPLTVSTTSYDPVGIDAPVVHLIDVEETSSTLPHATPLTVIPVVCVPREEESGNPVPVIVTT